MGGIAYQQFSTIVPFILLFFMGFLCGKSKLLDGKAIKTLGIIVMNVLSSFVVLDLLQIPKKSETSSELVWAIVSAIIVYFIFVLLSFLFFRNRKKETSAIYFCALSSSSVIILAYPLLMNISGSKAPIYTAAFCIVNKIFFGIICTKVINHKRKIIKDIINLSTVVSLLGFVLYFSNFQLLLPIANTVSKISEMVPTVSSLLVGMFLSTFPLKGFKLQFDSIILAFFKLFLLPLVISTICMLLKISLENTLILVILSGLPCGFELPCETSRTQEKNLPCASTLSALSFVLSVISIPVICYVTSQIYLFIY